MTKYYCISLTYDFWKKRKGLINVVYYIHTTTYMDMAIHFQNFHIKMIAINMIYLVLSFGMNDIYVSSIKFVLSILNYLETLSKEKHYALYSCVSISRGSTQSTSLKSVPIWLILIVLFSEFIDKYYVYSLK